MSTMSSRNTSVGSLDSQELDYPSSTCGSEHDPLEETFITYIHHVNLLVPPRTLHLARAFYTEVLGLRNVSVPDSGKTYLAWFEVGNSGQQIHITSQHQLDQHQMKVQLETPRHVCFSIPTQQKLNTLQKKIWQLHERGGEGDPIYCDEPDGKYKGPGGFPNRFFARDFAGNRLEFSL